MENSSDTNEKRPGREVQRQEEFPVAYPLEQLREAQEEELHLRDYFGVLLRRKWIAISFFLVVVTTVTLGTFLMTPVYRGSITIKIDEENPNVLKFKDYEIERSGDDYYQTQYKILKSRNLAKRVIRSTKLEEKPEFAKDEAPKAAAARKDTPEQGFDDGRQEAVGVPDQRLVDRFLGRLTIEPLPKTRLVKVSFDSKSPELAALVADTVGQTLIDYTFETKHDATQKANEWLEKQLDEMKAKVERSDEMLNKYAAEKGIIFVGEGGASGAKDTGRTNIVSKKLDELSTELVQATSERISKEALHRETAQGEAESSPVVLNNALLQALKKDLEEAEAEYAQLSKVWKPTYPKMVKLREQINRLKTGIGSETAKIVSGIRKDYGAALKRENTLRSTLEAYKGEALQFNEKMVQYQILQREADTNKELYNALLQRLKETGVTASLTANNIQILDRAEVPERPFRPKKALNILLALVVGLFGGVGLAFFAEYLDNTIKSPDDIEKGTQLSPLGLVPLFPNNVETSRLIAAEDKLSPLSEAFRSIGTCIQFSAAGRPPKTILITSARKGEGKTTTSINTASSLAQSCGKGIIIDTDLRMPQMHKILGLDNSAGLSTFLSGNMEFDDDRLIRETGIPNLDVITSGIVPPNPSELLSSARMKDLVNGLFPLYSFIILDAPPLLGLSDALVLSTIADGVVMVVRAGSTSKDAVVQAKKLLRGINARILGVVLNGFRETDLRYGMYSYYNEYYSYNREGKAPRRKGKAAAG